MVGIELLSIIQKLVAQGQTDPDIAEIIGARNAIEVAHFRHKHGIRSLAGKGARRGKDHWMAKASAMVKRPNAIDMRMENGVRIFIYPAMWAKGVSPHKNVRQRE